MADADEYIIRSPDGNEVARYMDYWATGAFEQHTNGDEAEINRLVGLGYYCRCADWPQEK